MCRCRNLVAHEQKYTMTVSNPVYLYQAGGSVKVRPIKPSWFLLCNDLPIFSLVTNARQ